ncbi:MAG: SsrA-binding protein SmpB [Candidatus Aegiribacteria sp.]|nr:SsrA-binding protein SmpB [Candidatus Aegiribacteria sp.]
MKNEVRTVARNRKARHEYHIMDSLEVGMVLKGSEIKSIRAGKVSLSGAYADFDGGNELWIIDMHIAEYPQARDNHDPYRKRKLLAHASQLRKLRRMVHEKGHTLIPLDVHLRGGRAKIELGLCRGKKQYDKRRDIAKKDAERKMRASMKRESRGYD